VFLNSSLIDAGSGDVTITMSTKDQSGSITAGQITAENVVIYHNGPTSGEVSGKLDFSELTINTNLTITANSARNVGNALGSVLVRGTPAISVGTGDVVIDRATTDLNFLSLIAKDATIVDTNAMQLAASTLTGNLMATTTGPIASTGPVVVNGTTSITANNGGFGFADPYINLSNAANNFGGLVTVNVPSDGETGTGGYVVLQDLDGVDIALANASEYMTLTAGGAVNVTKATISEYFTINSTSGNVDVTDLDVGGDLSITAPGGDVNVYGVDAADRAVVTGNIGISSLGTVNVVDAAVSGALTVVTDGTVDVARDGIGASVNITSKAAVDVVDALIGGSLTVATEGTVNVARDDITTSVNISTKAAVDVADAMIGSSLSIVTTNATTGVVDLGNVEVVQNLTVTTNSAISDSNSLIVPGNTTLTAGSANDIILDDPDNNFGRVRVASAKHVTFFDTNAIEFGLSGSTISGDLQVTAGGHISQYLNYQNTAPITVMGTANFTVTAAASDFLLGVSQTHYNQNLVGANNSFAGPVNLWVTGAGAYRDIQLNNTNAAAALVNGLDNQALRDVLFYYNNAATLELPSMTLSGNLIVDISNGGITQSASGPIVVDNTDDSAGFSTFRAKDDRDITLTHPNNDFGHFMIRDGRDISVVDIDDIDLYTRDYDFKIRRDLNILAGGDLTDSRNCCIFVANTSGGVATLNVGSTNNIILDDDTNYWATVTIPAANNVTLNPRNSLILGASNIEGSLSMDSRDGGTLTQSGIVTTGGTTTIIGFTAGITLIDANNIFGNLAISNPGNVSIRENDAITQASAWSINTKPVALTTSNDQAITLDQANILGSLTLTQINSGAPSAGAVHVRESSDSVHGITQSSAWTLHGTTTLDSGAYLINLNNANNILGPLQVLGATGSTNGVASTVTLYAKETVSQHAITDVSGTGAWATGAGVVKLIAYDTAGTTAGAGTINLSNVGNVLGDLYVIGNDVLITENDNITDGLSTPWDSTGTITGWVTSGTTTLVVANPSGKSLALDNTSHTLSPVLVATTGTAGTLTSALITDNSDLTQSAAWVLGAAPVTLDSRTHAIDLSTTGNVLGAVSVNTSNGTPGSVTLTEDDAITQGGVWALPVVPVNLIAENNKAITLTTSTNILGALTVTGGIVAITENDSINQSGAWTTTGATTLNPGTNAIVLTQAANVLGDVAITGAPSAVSITENDDITQASAWVQATTPFTLLAPGKDVLLSQNSNQLNDLTITAQNTSVSESDTAGITDANGWIVPGTTTLEAGSANPIALNANPSGNFGTVSIVSASNADIGDVDGIVIGATSIAAGGTLTITAGGAITQSAAITSPSLRLVGTGSGTLSNAGNNVQNLAAGFSGGDLIFANNGDFSVATVDGTAGITIGANDVTLTSATGTITDLANLNGASASVTVTTGTALSLPLMTSAGPQSYTASTVSGNGITLTGGATGTSAGAIDYYSPVTLAADLTIQSTDSDINFRSSVAGTTNQLVVNAGTGLVHFFGAVTALGNTSDTGSALQLTSSGAIFDSTLAGNNGIAVTGPVIFNEDVTFNDGNSGSIFAGLGTLGKIGGMDLSSYDGLVFNNGISLQNGPSTITSNNAALTFQTAGSVTGPYSLALDAGSQFVTGLDRVGANLTSLTVTGFNPTIPAAGLSIAGPQSYTAASGSKILLGGNVTSTAAGTVTFNSPAEVTASVTITSANSAIEFGDLLDGALDLTVNSGSGVKTFTGAIGSATPLGDGTGVGLILQGSGASTFSSTVQVLSGITVAGAATFVDDVTLTDGDSGSTFTSLVTTGGADGNIISGFDGLAFNGGLALVGGPVDITSNGSTISFGATVSGAQNLTLNALTGAAGTVSDLDRIGFSSNLTALSVTAHTLSLPSSGLAIAGPMAFTADAGLILNGAVGNSATPATGQIDFNSNITLATGGIAITSNDAALNFSGSVNGAQSLSLNNGSGTTTISSTIGNTVPLTSIASDVTGATAIDGGSIITSGAQTYNDAVTIGGDTTLTGVAVHFVNTLNGASRLLVNDAGATTFSDVVGGVAPLATLTTNATGTVVIDTNAITTSGAQTYNENVLLSSNTTLAGLGLTFNGKVNGAFSLDAGAGSCVLALNDSAGDSGALASVVATASTIVLHDITTSGTQGYTAVSGITLNGNLASTNSDVTFSGPAMLAADLQISSGAGAGNITFTGPTSTLNGAFDVTLAGGTGNVVLGGVVGGIGELAGITLTGNDLTIPGINTVGDANQVFIALNDVTLNQSRTLSAPISFTADADNSGSGTFTLLNGVSLTASNNTLSLAAADLDLQGSSTLSSGSGLMTLSASNARNIGLGEIDAAGQMTISGDELSRMTSSGGMDLKTTGAGGISVNGILASQSQNITGITGFRAQGTGDIEFVTALSTFNAFTSNAAGGLVNVGVNLTATNDPIIFDTPVAIAGASTISSSGGDITFANTVSVDNNLVLTTDNGILTFTGTVGSNKELVLNLGGGSVTGLGQLQTSLTGLTVNSASGINLPAFTISGPQIYNTGVITATGDLGGVGLTFNNVVNVVPASGTSLALNAGTGTLTFNEITGFSANDMTLIGDEINFVKAVTGSGLLKLQPATTSLDVAVGGNGAAISGLNLTAADISWLPIGTLSSLTFGRADGTGTLDVTGPINALTRPLSLYGGGGITQSGGSVTGDALTLGSNAGIVLDNSANDLGAISIVGAPTSVSIADSTAITQGASWALGSAPVTLNAGAGSLDITLAQGANTFGGLVLSGKDIIVNELANTDFGTTSAASLTVVSAGGIATSGTMVVSGLADFTSLDDAGSNITIANNSTLGSVNAVARNGANNANASGNISLALDAPALLKNLATTGNVSLQVSTGNILSQDGASTLTAAGLELLGAGGQHSLALGSNAITTLAGNSGTVSFAENSGFAIGTVNTVGLTTSGDLTLSSAGSVTATEAVSAAGLELLGTAGIYTLTDSGNAITTLAAIRVS
jgi:hypothetical protein